jgi:hypothetical protein
VEGIDLDKHHTQGTPTGEVWRSQKVSPPSPKNRRNSEGPGGARRVSRVLADFWSGFPGGLGPFEFMEFEASDHRRGGGDLRHVQNGVNTESFMEASTSVSFTSRTTTGESWRSQKVSPPSPKNRRNSEGPGGARRVSRVLADFWSGFPGGLGPFEFIEFEASDHRRGGGDLRHVQNGVNTESFCGGVDFGKPHGQYTDGRRPRVLRPPTRRPRL